MSFGVDPRNPLEYSKINYYLVPCVDYPRRPISGVGGDYDFKINTIWHVGNTPSGGPPTTGTVGEEWILITKTGGYAQGNQNPTWIQINGGSSGPMLMFQGGAGTTGTFPVTPDGLGNITLSSSAGTVVITGSPNALNFDITGGVVAIEKFVPDTGTNPVTGNTITMTNSSILATGTLANALRSNGLSATSLAYQTQFAGSNAAVSTANNYGVSQFDSNMFTVTSGFVQLKGGGVNPAVIKVTPDTGTTPVVADATGNMNFSNTALFATGTNATGLRANGTGANTVAYQLQLAGSNAGSSTANNFGVAQFDANQFTVTSGFVQISNFSPLNYVAITHNGTNPSPYTVSATDKFISCDTKSSTAGTIQILLPNAPTTNRTFTIKDRTGGASVNNISITTVGGAVTIDGQTTYKLASNYAAVDLLFNGTSYEVF